MMMQMMMMMVMEGRSDTTDADADATTAATQRSARKRGTSFARRPEKSCALLLQI